MRRCTLQIAADDGTGPTYHVEVRVYKSLRTMRRAIGATCRRYSMPIDGDDEARCEAMCLSFPDDNLAYLFFSETDLDNGTIAHEASHAAEGLVGQRKTGEEKRAQFVEQITREVEKWLA